MSQQFRSPKGAALSQPRPSGLGNVDHETQGLKAQYKMPVAYKIEWDSNASLQGICARRASWSLRCEAGVPSEALIQGLQPSLADATMLPRPSGLGWDRCQVPGHPLHLVIRTSFTPWGGSPNGPPRWTVGRRGRFRVPGFCRSRPGFFDRHVAAVRSPRPERGSAPKGDSLSRCRPPG